MTFPVQIPVAGMQWHPHLFFEIIAYVFAVTLYFFLRHRAGRAAFPPDVILSLICGCLLGAWIGSKLLVAVTHPGHLRTFTGTMEWLASGKSTVGALLGGWGGITLVKLWCRIRTTTGEFFLYPMAVGTALGRLGCFFTGLADQTHGLPSRLPWAVDFGDGIPRHPAQLYEAIYVLLLAALLPFIPQRLPASSPRLFRRYLAGYLAFRFLLSFWMPRERWIGELDMFQFIVGLVLAGLLLRRIFRPTTQLPTQT